MHRSLSPRFSPNLRVHEMLRNARNRVPTHSSESLVQSMPNYSQAFASTMHGQQSGGGKSSASTDYVSTLNNPQNTNVFVCVCTFVIFTICFVGMGSYVDARTQNYVETENTEHDYQTHLLLLSLQLCFNVAMLALPYALLYNYAPNSYACQYYIVAFALWVLALHAQPHLKNRFYTLLDNEPPSNDTPSLTAGVTREEHDQVLISQHLHEANHQKQNQTHSQAEPENIQYRPNRSQRTAPRMQFNDDDHHTPNYNQPMQFHSQDLLPAQQHPPIFSTSPDTTTHGTNIADLL